MFLPALGGVALIIAACAPTAEEKVAASTDTASSWRLMRHIKLATFSARDPRAYELMIFCDPPGHVRVYHFAPAAGLGGASDLSLRSGEARLAVEGQREEVRATPPPVSSEPGPLLGVRVHARIRIDAPVMRAFVESGRLEAASGNHVTRADANQSERDMLAAFFGAECG